MALKTPEKIRILQRKLYDKAKQALNFRFYALYDKVYRCEVLAHAYRLVRANGGAPGIDGVSSQAIEDAGERVQFLTELAQQLMLSGSVMLCREGYRKAVYGRTVCTV